MSPVTIFGGGSVAASLVGLVFHHKGVRWVAAPLFFAAIVLGVGGIIALFRQL